MTKNIKNLLIVLGLVVAVGTMGTPFAFAAHDDITFSADVDVDLSDPDVTLTIVSGSEVASYVVNAGTIDFNLENGSNVIVRSTDHYVMSGTGGTASLQCATAYSEIGKGSATTQTWTVTPTTSTCTQQQASGGGTPNGGSTTGGSTTGGSTTTTTTTTTTTIATPATTTTATTASATLLPLPYAVATTRAEMLANLEVLLKNVAVLQALLPATTSYTFTKFLSVGSSGTEVTNLQTVLKNQGLFTGEPTGYFGALTKAAVKAFQAKYGIDQLGYVCPGTRAKLNSL